MVLCVCSCAAMPSVCVYVCVCVCVALCAWCDVGVCAVIHGVAVVWVCITWLNYKVVFFVCVAFVWFVCYAVGECV